MDLNKLMSESYKQRRDSAMRQGTKKSHSTTGSKPPDSDGAQKKRTKADHIISEVEKQPMVTFQNLFGCDEAIQQINKIIDRFQRFLQGLATKSGWPVLICGSRGLGKTSLVEAAAEHANLKLFSISFKSLIEQSRNELKVTLNFIAKHCRANQPGIVLLDDLDLATDKEDLKPIIDGFLMKLSNIDLKLLVFCTASSSLDLKNSVDFLYNIQLKRPNLQARLSILKQLREGNPNLSMLNDEELNEVAIDTPSFSPLDLKKVLDFAETDSSNKPTKHNCDIAIKIVKQSFRQGTHLIGEKPTITWNDIGGLPEVRHVFSDILRKIKTGNINCKFTGIALYGPPGCGKTMIAQAMANEAGLNFISIKPAELVDKFLGETEKNIRRIFSEAQEHEPCMIYFDEFDGLCGTRGNRDTVTSAIQTLLSEMDGFVNRGKSIILASTNRLEDIDPAMKRPGRLSKHIYVGPPGSSARLEILKVITKSFTLSQDIDLNYWAGRTEGFTGADLAYLIAESELKASSENMQVDLENESSCVLDRNHLEFAYEVLMKTNMELSNKFKTSSL